MAHSPVCPILFDCEARGVDVPAARDPARSRSLSQDRPLCGSQRPASHPYVIAMWIHSSRLCPLSLAEALAILRCPPGARAAFTKCSGSVVVQSGAGEQRNGIPPRRERGVGGQKAQ